MNSTPQGFVGERRGLEQDEAIEAQVAREAREAASELARPYMATGRTLEEALDAIREDGFDPDFDLPASGPEGGPR